jgi:hypothetical protein
MSLRMMTLVWEKSQHKGSELLLLLAIADNTNDQGVAFPSIKTLARKTRLSIRNVRYVILRLEHSGELEVSIGTGPRGCNEYRIHIPTLQKLQGMISTPANERTKPPAKALAPEPTTKTNISPFSLSPGNVPNGTEGEPGAFTPEQLKDAGFTPGSLAWRVLLGMDESDAQRVGT